MTGGAANCDGTPRSTQPQPRQPSSPSSSASSSTSTFLLHPVTTARRGSSPVCHPRARPGWGCNPDVFHLLFCPLSLSSFCRSSVSLPPTSSQTRDQTMKQVRAMRGKVIFASDGWLPSSEPGFV
ncbi:hypothetical protein KM043_014965 [Ampulex compressa]|nr:hypothetical protein KM043_014965 [Ampulex compressa]